MRVLDWQAPQKIGDVEVPVLVGRDGDQATEKTSVPVYSWTISRLPGSNTGHGHIWQRPDCATVDCGGAPDCDECQEDADLVAEMLESVTDAPVSFRATFPPQSRANDPVLTPDQTAYLEGVHRTA